jgi:hypothetical protein
MKDEIAATMNLAKPTPANGLCRESLQLDEPETTNPSTLNERSALPLGVVDWLVTAWTEHQRQHSGSHALVTLNPLRGKRDFSRADTELWLQHGAVEVCQRFLRGWRSPRFKYARPIGFFIPEISADDNVHAHGLLWLPPSIATRPMCMPAIADCFKATWPFSRGKIKPTSVDVRSFYEDHGLAAYMRKSWPRSDPEDRRPGFFPAGRFLRDDYATLFSKVDELEEKSLQEQHKANAQAAKVGELLRDRRLTSEALRELLPRPSSS